MASFVKLAVAMVLLSLIGWGLYDQVVNIHQNDCEMTYMYEHPIYLPVQLPPFIQQKYPYYSLYIYGEGNYAEQLARKQYSGVPVLFIPGNGGSYKQVRSLASVSYRKSMDQDTPRVHFNFYTVDLNEELAAFYGPSLNLQAQFVNDVVKFILTLYEDAIRKPSSVILVGHSMGGLVARAVPVLTRSDPAMTPLIITQATPHTRPVISFDAHIARFYNMVNKRWEQRRNRQLRSVVLVSVGGGRNDVQVPHGHVLTPLADVTASTLEVPGCWVTADHQAIVWCKQLVKATVRALFESIDSSTFLLGKNRQKIVDIFRYHMNSKSSGKDYRSSHHTATLTSLDRNYQWSEITKRQYYYHHPKTSRDKFLMFALRPKHRSYQRVTVVAVDLDKKDWVFTCLANVVHNNTRICSGGENLSNWTYTMPGKRKVVQLDLRNIDKQKTHLVLWMPYTDSDDENTAEVESTNQGRSSSSNADVVSTEEIDLYVDIHSEESRTTIKEAPTLAAAYQAETILESTTVGTLVHSVNLTGFYEAWQSYSLVVSPLNKCVPKLPSAVTMITSWENERRFNLLSSPVRPYSREFVVELDVAPFDRTQNHSVRLELLLDPTCQYSATLEVDITGVFRRLAQLYGPQLPAYFLAQVLAMLAYQYKHYATEGKCDSLLSTLGHISPLAIVPFVKASAMLLRILEVDDDFQILENHGMNLGLLPVLLFMIALPVTCAVCGGVWISVIVTGRCVHEFVLRVLQSIGGGDAAAEIIYEGLAKIPIVVSVALMSLGYSTSGVLALSCAVIFYFVKIFKLYEEYLETQLLKLLPGGKEKRGEGRDFPLSSARLHLLLLVLLGYVVLMGMPTLVTWARLVRDSHQLSADPSLPPTMICLIALCVIWQKQVPDENRRYYRPMGFVLNGLAVLVVLIGSVNLYRSVYLASTALLLVAMHQILAPKYVNGNKNASDISAASSNNTGAGITDITSDTSNEVLPDDTDASESLSSEAAS